MFRKKSEEEEEISFQTIRVSEEVFPSLLSISYTILCLWDVKIIKRLNLG